MSLRFIYGEIKRIYRVSGSSLWFAFTTAFFLSIIFNFLLGLYLYLNNFVKKNDDILRVRVYMENSISKDYESFLNDFFASSICTKDVRFISKKNAIHEFTDMYPEYKGLLGLFDKNPLPESFELTIDVSMCNRAKFNRFLKQIKSLPYVSDIFVEGKVLPNLLNLLEIIWIIFWINLIIFVIILLETSRGAMRTSLEKKVNLLKVYNSLGGAPQDILIPFQTTVFLFVMSGSILSSVFFYLPFIYLRFDWWLLLVAPFIAGFVSMIMARDEVESYL